MPPSYRSPRSQPAIVYTYFPSPLGGLGIAATSRGICRISWGHSRASSFRRWIEKRHGGRVVRRDPDFFPLIAALRKYFSGRPVRFEAKLDLGGGTPFQRSVWEALRRIPHGTTRSYGAVARALGRPKSSRAVGSACGSNPVPILIPCHRVVRTGGELGGFGGGIGLKKRLLSIERA